MQKDLVGKVLYGTLFCIAIPTLLYWWGSRLYIPLMLPASALSFGLPIFTFGILLMVAAMRNLWKVGKGLPMNAYPPSVYVTLGAYKLFRHPIYTGFCFACVGVSLALQSPSGFYLVSPVVVLLCIALVQGYEGRDIQERFDTSKHQPLFGLPSQRILTWSVRWVGFFCAFVPWFTLYEVLIFLGTGDNYINTMAPWESKIPVVELAEIPYALTYIFVGLVPFILQSTQGMRRFVVDAWLLTAVGIFLQCVLPLYAEPRAFEPTSFMGDLILIERTLDGPAAAFPSFHVIWALLAMRSWSIAYPQLQAIFRSLALLIIISCVLTGVHSILDVIAGIAVFFAVDKKEKIAKVFRHASERLANSWKAWNIGSLRIINHSIYAGSAAFIGIFIAAQFGIGIITLLTVTVCSVVGGAVWAQLIEGSKKMLRPFGFYGALIGGIVGVAISSMCFGADPALTFAAFAIASPLTQAVGRLRCLVQGCCHGRPVDEKGGLGIQYVNEHSRVCLSGLKGQTIHNTQAYSMIANVIIAIVLFRLTYTGVDASLTTGLFFILSGIARFIEEGYRGEVQTRKMNGLSCYQALAIVSVLAGICISAFPAEKVLHFNLALNWEVLTVAGLAGFVWAFAMGMDFPKSSARFARLTG